VDKRKLINLCTQTVLKTHLNTYLGSRDFWYCNTVAWLFYILINSIHLYYFIGDLYSGIPGALVTAGVGTLTLLIFRYFYFKQKRYEDHPLAWLPIICLVAILFAFVRTILMFRNCDCSIKGTINLLSVIFSDPSSHPEFDTIISVFISFTYLMLAWLMAYLFIEAERMHIKATLKKIHVILSIVFIIFIYEAFQAMTIFAYYNVEGYLFSSRYFFQNFLTRIFCILLSFYVILLKPGDRLLKSYFIPQIPLFMILVFCSSIFSTLLFNLIPFVQEIFTSDTVFKQLKIALSVFYEKDPLWKDSVAFLGIFQRMFNEHLLMALFFLLLTYSNRWIHEENNLVRSLDFKKSLQFWIYNFLGWSSAGLYCYLSNFLDIKKYTQGLDVFVIIVFIILGSIFCSIFRNTIKHYQLVNKPLIVFIYTTIGISIILGTLLACALSFSSYVYVNIIGANEDIIKNQYLFKNTYYFYKTIPLFSACFVIWSLIYEISVSQRNKINAKLKEFQLEKNIKEAQLHALSVKIDPHFIFNALNNIDSLVRENNAKAREAILVLANILRTPISNTSVKKVRLAQELDFVKNYIALSALHLECKLIYQENIDPHTLNACIPPMMLQIMIENAIKHGISKLPQGGKLQLHIYSEPPFLICKVSNTGSIDPHSHTQGLGIGINNIQERLKLLYEHQATFRLFEDNNRVVAELRLPLEYLYENNDY
jgi:two-component system, LytTR family, sensor kinase